MKKNFCALLILFCVFMSAFADKSLFFENGKVIDTMYVNSKEGLKVRDKPSLKSNRICGLPHRIPVKIVAIGKEETIDKITAPWIEILLPVYEWKSDKAEYGWVFGGYLSSKQPDFVAPKTPWELEQYLTSIRAWDEYKNNNSKERYYVFIFGKDKRFWHGKDGSGIGEGGEWKVLSKDAVQFHTGYVMEYDENYYWDLTFKFQKDGSFYADNDYYYPSYESPEDSALYSVTSKGNLIDYYLGIEYWSPYSTPMETKIMEAISWGISAKGTAYEEKYHNYWAPIMEEHQIAADRD